MAPHFPQLFLILFLNCGTAFASDAFGSGVLPPPRNVSLKRENYFCLRLSWTPPEGLENLMCPVSYTVKEKSLQEAVYTRLNTFYNNCLGMESGVTYTVQTKCGNKTESEAIVRNISAPSAKLVENFQCFYYMSEAMNCTWEPKGTSLELLYWYEGLPALKLCTTFLYHGDMKIGCHLSGAFLNHRTYTRKVFFLFRGKHGTSTLNNSFEKLIQESVKPPPPQIRLHENGSTLLASWDPPNMFDRECWDYELRYRKSDSEKWYEHIVHKQSQHSLLFDRRFEYRVQIKSETVRCGTGGSDWSLEAHYGQHQPPDWSQHVAFIAIPILVTLVVVLSLVFFKRFRKLILPEIPNPRDLLKDWLNDSEEKMLPELLVPQEDVCAKVNVVEKSQPLTP
ncbi:interleukin-13 receptor subunit alpha-1 [Scleropages formosus]|uniref:Interleukin-13 receptor subunit alpha-2-like n=1 Tax=Scleropages formosus TaxID=113540 RepID=A0A8C9W1Q7_SCLFO|nr:interleukin-13 receptor subunit alpha-2-like [Scleropages formosus]